MITAKRRHYKYRYEWVIFGASDIDNKDLKKKIKNWFRVFFSPVLEFGNIQVD